MRRGAVPFFNNCADSTIVHQEESDNSTADNISKSDITDTSFNELHPFSSSRIDDVDFQNVSNNSEPNFQTTGMNIPSVPIISSTIEMQTASLSDSRIQSDITLEKSSGVMDMQKDENLYFHLRQNIFKISDSNESDKLKEILPNKNWSCTISTTNIAFTWMDTVLDEDNDKRTIYPKIVRISQY